MTRARLTTDDNPQRVAQAVADPTRLRVLRYVQAADDAVTVGEVAERFGLHPNVVCQHLAHLRDAGLLTEEAAHRGGPGRPRLTYRPNAEAPDVVAGWNPYETLATLLVDVAAGTPALEVGAAYGRRLGATAPEAGAVELLVGVARRHGFRPMIEPGDGAVDLVLGRCPFAASVTGDRLSSRRCATCRVISSSSRQSRQRACGPTCQMQGRLVIMSRARGLRSEPEVASGERDADGGGDCEGVARGGEGLVERGGPVPAWPRSRTYRAGRARVRVRVVPTRRWR